MRGRRIGRPGLVGTMARTAVIAGTASAVSGNVQRRQATRYSDQQELAAAREQQRAAEAAQAAQAAAYPPQAPPGYPPQAPAYPPQPPAGYAPPAAPPEPAPAAAPSAADAMMTQLAKLGEMHGMGLLTDEEFAAAKARLLSS
jgi:type II secretory pathway pseudopilin PulG